VLTNLGTNKEEKKKIKDSASMELEKYVNTGLKYKVIEKCWEETPDKRSIIVPRFCFPAQEKYHRNKVILEDTHNTGVPPTSEMTLITKPKQFFKQDKIVTTTLAQLHKIHGAVVSAPCGYGKTYCLLSIACSLKLRTFILVHKKHIAKQWIKAIKQHISPDTLCYTYETNSHFSKESWEREMQSDFVVGLMQSVCHAEPIIKSNPDPNMSISAKWEKDERLRNRYGLVIVDEAHHCPAKTMQECLLKFNAKYLLGCSATEVRKDGRTNLMYWSLGPLAIKVTREAHENYELRTIKLPPVTETCPDMKTINDYVSWLASNEKRTDQIVECVKRELYADGRVTIVMTARAPHVEVLYKKFAGLNVFKLYGKMTDIQQSREQSRMADASAPLILVTTFQYLNEGYDFPRTDAMALVTPAVNICQAIGRAMRMDSRKKNPVIYLDFSDQDGSRIGRMMMYKRQAIIRAETINIKCVRKKF
jgi:superfamily II DNA or RNA helicase